MMTKIDASTSMTSAPEASALETSAPEASAFTPGAPDGAARSVVCYAGTRRRATEVARVVANREHCLVYVLKGYRPNRRGFRSPAYYVSLHASPEIKVDGLPPLELIGPPYSSPRLLETLSPVPGAPGAPGPIQ